MEMDEKLTVTYLGHATLLFEMDGIRLLCDPIFRNRITFLVRTGHPVDPAPLRNVDAVLISHLHHDHLDFASLAMLGPKIRIIAPQGAGKLLEKHGYLNYQEIKIDETIRIGGVEVKAVFADHVRSRQPLGPQADCIGFVLKGSLTAYYPGDTRLFPGMADLAERLDLAMLPVWGWGPDRGKMHMGPREAAESLTLLKPRYSVPIHWGTFIPFGLHWFRLRFHYLPPTQFIALAQMMAPQVITRILLPGQSLEIEVEENL
jgi:L-ascorbate metabolism protein UlaG (beta-lactamase superfamily)